MATQDRLSTVVVTAYVNPPCERAFAFVSDLRKPFFTSNPITQAVALLALAG